jgi:hypothetical protein
MVSLFKLRNQTFYPGISPVARDARSNAIWYAFGAERADVQPLGGFAFAFGDAVARWLDAHPGASTLPAGMEGAYAEFLAYGRMLTVEEQG